jgi:hypothetical protein
MQMKRWALGMALAASACVGAVDGGSGGDDDDTAGGADAAPGDPPPDGGGPGAPDADLGPQPGDGVEWLDYPEQHGQTDSAWCGILVDIIQHIPAGQVSTYADGNDLCTDGHEVSHGIHAHLRNNYNDTGQQANAFYVGDDRAAIVVEPDIRKSQVAPYIPASLRELRYGTYVTGQTAWDDTPLYLWDEWNAYVNGAAVGVELFDCGKWTYGWRDQSGNIEFVGYALAVGMAVEELDPDYFAGYPQFREFLAWNLARSMDLYRRTRAMPDFQSATDDALHASLTTSADAAALREFAVRTFGAAWTADVLGF